ncbi:MAG TPA: hypothetical protein VH575_07180 [Gemmataceae bacterium]
MAKTTSTLTFFVVFTAALVLLSGCSSRSGEEAPAAFGELREVNDLLHAAAGTTGRPPAKLADLDRHQSLFSRGYEAVKSGNVVVLWGAPLKGEEDAGKEEAVVAYEKAVPTEGGYVLLSAGTVKKMSAAEFQAAPKAK